MTPSQSDLAKARELLDAMQMLALDGGNIRITRAGHLNLIALFRAEAVRDGLEQAAKICSNKSADAMRVAQKVLAEGNRDDAIKIGGFADGAEDCASAIRARITEGA